MSERWLVAVGLVLVALGGLLAHLVQTAGDVTVSDIRFAMGDGEEQSALLYRPAAASADNPAPAILATHGYINSRETQSAFAIEFARRGFVVLAIDQSGHGFSDGTAFSKGFGGPPALAYLRSVTFVDAERIGLEGHSMGGWASLAAAGTFPDAYRGLALVGSSTGPPFAAPGTPEWPRNVAVIFSQYDEFAPLMWEVPRATSVDESAKLRTLFGTAETIDSGRLYGNLEDGSARILTTPAVTHAGDHFSTEAIGDAVAWMDRVIGAPNPISTDNQIWMWKEIGTLMALVGSMVFLLGFFGFLARRSPLAIVDAAGARETIAPVLSWRAIVLAALLPALTFYPATMLGALATNIALFPQNVTNQIVVWALVNTLIAWALSRKVFVAEPHMLRAVALGIIAVTGVYAVVWLSGILFQTDMRFWVVALKPMADHHWLIFLVYLAPFTLFFYVTQRIMLTRLTTVYWPAILASVGGLTALLAIAYGWLFATAALPPFFDPLFTIILIQFVPVLAMTAVIGVFCWRRTGLVWPGAWLCGLLVTWYVVAGQATHV